MSSDRSAARPLSVVLHVDAGRDWHDAARLLGEFVRAAGGLVTISCALLTRGAREAAIGKARELLGLPDAQVATDARAGIVEFTLPNVARRAKADVVVIGPRGAADRLTSGLLANLVARRTPASVLVARGRPKSVRKILLCVESERHGTKRLELAARIAKVFGARLDILHVVDQMGLTDLARDEIDEDLRDFLHSDAPEAATLRALDAHLHAQGIEGAILVRAGLVVDEIIEAVRDGGHDLLVIGAHEAHTQRAGLYEDFGSLILRASPTSTLIVRDPAPDANLRHSA
ncbi:MAG TPA: universal stress protein [Candidatus Thermoplasmatota archaeon]|nr:universal stress protein [Candidatus Thermoplasmatota archaeon]